MASIPSNQPFNPGYSLESCPTEQFLLFRSLVLRSLQRFLRKTAKAGTSEHPQRAGTQGHLKSHSCLCSLSALVSWLDLWCFDSTSDQAQRVSSAVGLLPLCLFLLLRHQPQGAPTPAPTSVFQSQLQHTTGLVCLPALQPSFAVPV